MEPEDGQATNDGGVSLVIPAYNEELAITEGLAEARTALESTGRPFEIIVVDDGSSDRTGELAAAQPGIRLLTQPVNRGYGAALKAGIGVAKYDTIVITDADGTYPAQSDSRHALEICRSTTTWSSAPAIGDSRQPSR